jgi:hypothetical protein
MTLILVILIRKYDHNQDFVNDTSNTVNRNQQVLNSQKYNYLLLDSVYLLKIISKESQIKSYTFVDRINNYEPERFDREDLIELKRIRILDQKCWSILKEALINVVFLFVLYYVAFSNITASSMQYNFLYQNNFAKSQTPKEIGLFDVII